MMKMMRRRKDSIESEGRRVLRTGREDAAGKFRDRAPDVTSLSLDIRAVGPLGVNDTHYIRRVVVGQASALFDIPCSDPECLGGGHDMTDAVLLALDARKEQFQGESSCHGRCGERECGQILRYAGAATYRAADPAARPQVIAPTQN